MKLLIKSGHNRPAAWWKQLRLWYNKREIKKIFMFDPSCKYEIDEENQGDYNKLFGLGYFWNKKESARIGWRWDPVRLKFVLAGYCHVDGKIVFQEIFDGAIASEKYMGIIMIVSGAYIFKVLTFDEYALLGATGIPHRNKKKLSYALGFYFGGGNTKLVRDTPAPHEMGITIQNA